MTKLFAGQRVMYNGQERIIDEVAPRTAKNGSPYIAYERGLTLKRLSGNGAEWAFQHEVTPIEEEAKKDMGIKVGTKLKLNHSGATEDTMHGFSAGDIVEVLVNPFGESDHDYRVESQNKARGYLSKTEGGFEVVGGQKEQLEAILSEIRRLSVQAVNILESVVEDNAVHIAELERTKAIEMAKKDVETLTRKMDNGQPKSEGTDRYRHYHNKPEFHINRKKGVVTALVKGARLGQVHDKGIARCNPSDTFDEHIGKAIALRRGLGLDIPKEYTTLGGNE